LEGCGVWKTSELRNVCYGHAVGVVYEASS
jgi:hypothetical protein